MVVSGEESHYSESGTSSASANKGVPGETKTKKRQYRRSSRMTATVDGVAIKHGKRKRWSPEKVEAKTAAWEEGQKKKWNKGACECGGTEGKHVFLVSKEDYRIKRMCRGSIAETVTACGMELVTKEDSDCIRQALQENEEFESEYANNAKPTLSGKNVEEAMEVNPTEGKSKAPEAGTPPPPPPNEYEEIFKRDKEAFEREKEIGRTLREKKERQRKNREKARETSKGRAQNEAEPGPSEAEETHFKKVIKNAIKSVQEEELDLENRVAIRRTENKRKYREKSPNTKGFLKAQDEINNLDKDISNAARIWTEKSVQEMKANHHKISSIPFSVLEQSYRESTYDYWVDKMTSKYQGERNILRNQIRILRDVPPSSPELAVKVAKEDFPAQRPGRRHAQIPNPIKGKGKLIQRPTIETSNRFGVLENEGTSEPDTEKEIEPETSQEWAQVKQRRKGGKKAPNLTVEIAETEGDPSSPKRKAKLPAETTRTETDGEKGDSGGPSSQNRMLRSPAKANSTETDGGRTKGNKTAPKKAAKQDMGIKNMPPLVVDKIFTFGQGIRKELERKLEKDFNVKFNDNSTTIRTSTEKDYQTMVDFLDRLKVDFHTAKERNREVKAPEKIKETNESSANNEFTAEQIQEMENKVWMLATYEVKFSELIGANKREQDSYEDDYFADLSNSESGDEHENQRKSVQNGKNIKEKLCKRKKWRYPYLQPKSREGTTKSMHNNFANRRTK
ncbi:hypothetical protein JTB14_021151 [Gonioctena quinquepunctata]|nr:hypothetical protein JTB14_021151 [Gonioctena quinquepunctata]